MTYELFFFSSSNAQGLVQQAMLQAYEHRHSLREVQLKLAFKCPPRFPIHIGSRIVDATGNPLEIILTDAKTGSPLALPMVLEIELVPLYGDFTPDDYKEYWSAEEFETAIVTARQGNVRLLKGGWFGNICVTMTAGHVTLPEPLQFTDDSSWVRCRKFRFGAYVLKNGYYNGSFRIVEAISKAFEVEAQKHYPPVLGDPIRRLDMIDKDGPAHKKLTSINVDTVQEFQRMAKVKPGELRAVSCFSLIILSGVISHCALIRAVPFYDYSAFCRRSR